MHPEYICEATNNTTDVRDDGGGNFPQIVLDRDTLNALDRVSENVHNILEDGGHNILDSPGGIELV